MKFSQLNEESYLEELDKVNFNYLVNETSVEEAANTFSAQIMKAAKLSMPVKTVKIKANSPPWLNDEILLLRDKKQRIHTIAKRKDTPEHWRHFREVRNQLTDEIRKRKKNYLSELDDRISKKGNFGTKDFWKLVNSFIKKTSTNKNEIPPLEYEDKIIYENHEKANCFNRYFQSQSIITNEEEPLPLVEQHESQMTTPVLTVEETTATIINLNTTKAIGPDLIHNILIKTACIVIEQPLTDLFNKSLSEGIFPSIWKTAHVTPIHKKGSRSICSNYRPISLLSCVGKVMEKCIQKHLTSYLKQNEIITNSQSGFTHGDSTTYQLLNMYDDLSLALDNNITTQAIFFDISKAFDRVWHKGLLHKLRSIGVMGPLLTWFND